MDVRFIAPIFVHLDNGNDETQEVYNQKEYYPYISTAVNNSMQDEENPSGFVEYADDELIKKYCKSAIVSVRIAKDNQLESVCTCKIEGIEKNHPDFSQLLKFLEEEITGQYSDGWGEGFEQRPIQVNNYGYKEEIYVSFWNYNNWKMKTEILP